MIEALKTLLMYAGAFMLAVFASWLVISAILATFLWICDTTPRDSWWRIFKDIFVGIYED